jgi:hypothetical protein
VYLPLFLQGTHNANFLVPVVWTLATSSSISHIGVVPEAVHPSCVPEFLLHRLHSLLVRHIRFGGLDGQSDVASERMKRKYTTQLDISRWSEIPLNKWRNTQYSIYLIVDYLRHRTVTDMVLVAVMDPSLSIALQVYVPDWSYAIEVIFARPSTVPVAVWNDSSSYLNKSV